MCITIDAQSTTGNFSSIVHCNKEKKLWRFPTWQEFNVFEKMKIKNKKSNFVGSVNVQILDACTRTFPWPTEKVDK